MKSLSKYAAWSLIAQLGILATTTFSQEPPAPATAQLTSPRVQFSETNFNFGTVQPTDLLRHDFIVTNTGNALLTITNVQPGCGCTTTGEWDREIAPGKTGRIPIQFKPVNFRGAVTKAVMVFCNDLETGFHTLHIQATVLRPFDVQPPFVNFLPVEGEATGEAKVVHIVSNQEEAVVLGPPASENPVFQAELKTVRPGKEFELLVSYDKTARNGQGSITIPTSGTNPPALSINVSLRPQPAIFVMPPVVRVQPNPNRTEQAYSVAVRNNSNSDVKLSEATVNFEGATAEIHEIQPGKNFTIRLSLPADFKAQSGKETVLTLKTTHPKYPVLKVPLVQMPGVAPAASQVKATPADAK